MTAEYELALLRARLDEYEEIANKRMTARARELKEIDGLRKELERADSILAALIMMCLLLGLFLVIS